MSEEEKETEWSLGVAELMIGRTINARADVLTEKERVAE
jgi:hypothetical protein